MKKSMTSSQGGEIDSNIEDQTCRASKKKKKAPCANGGFFFLHAYLISLGYYKLGFCDKVSGGVSGYLVYSAFSMPVSL